MKWYVALIRFRGLLIILLFIYYVLAGDAGHKVGLHSQRWWLGILREWWFDLTALNIETSRQEKGSLSQWRRTCQVRHTAGWKLYLLIAWLFCFTSINAEVLALYMYIHIMFCLFTGCVHFPCQNDGICTDSIDGRYTCKCINGFSGDQCTDIKGKIRQIHVQLTA